jgi:hypothetical protein
VPDPAAITADDRVAAVIADALDGLVEASPAAAIADGDFEFHLRVLRKKVRQRRRKRVKGDPLSARHAQLR